MGICYPVYNLFRTDYLTLSGLTMRIMLYRTTPIINVLKGFPFLSNGQKLLRNLTLSAAETEHYFKSHNARILNNKMQC